MLNLYGLYAFWKISLHVKLRAFLHTQISGIRICLNVIKFFRQEIGRPFINNEHAVCKAEAS
jgi:hypothetical protein